MEKINITELLRNCPTGMGLDCMIYEDVYFDYIDELNIIHCYIQHDTHKTSITFNQYGTPNSDIKSKCVIFPKGKTTWKGFHRPFMNGDVIYNKDINALAIFYKQTITSTVSHCFFNVLGELRIYHYHSKDLSDWNFATEEEKEKLFKVIKDNGYYWDDEKNILEKRPEFKIGNKIRLKKNHNYIYTITGIREKENKYECGATFVLKFSEHNDWELVPDKFDISKLKPFDKVLVRDKDTQKWGISFFDGYNGLETYKYSCINSSAYAQCIPYKGNEHLRNTTNECDKFFKVWEE